MSNLLEIKEEFLIKMPIQGHELAGKLSLFAHVTRILKGYHISQEYRHTERLVCLNGLAGDLNPTPINSVLTLLVLDHFIIITKHNTKKIRRAAKYQGHRCGHWG